MAKPQHPPAGDTPAVAAAEACLEQARPAAAAKIAAEILARTPDDPRAHRVLGLVLMLNGRALPAVATLERALLGLPDEPVALAALARGLLVLGERERSAHVLNAAASRHPASLRLRLAVAEHELLLDHPHAAVRILRDLASEDPQSQYLWFLLAHALLADQEQEPAVEARRRAEQLGARPSLDERLAERFENAGLHDAALAAVRRGLRFAPGHPGLRHLDDAFSGRISSRAPEEYVRAMFDASAPTFDTHLRDDLEYRTPELVESALRRARAAPDGSLAVLDAGCGTGLLGPLLRPWARELSGVDISPGMLERARSRGVYDELHEAELTQALRRWPRRFDVVVAADVLIYFGALDEIVALTAAALRPGGSFTFSLERGTAAVELRRSGRYAHGVDMTCDLLRAAGFETILTNLVTLRKERAQPVAGHVVVASLPG